MLGRIVKDNKIFGYLVIDSTSNKKFVILRKDVNKYIYDNVKVSKDNKVHGNLKTYAYEEIYKDSSNNGKIRLYHGSKDGITGSISCRFSSDICDFGKGFYTGEKIEQAINRVSNQKNGIIYTFETDLSNLKIYRFNNDTEWALYVGVNRGKIDIKQYRKLRILCDKINSSDVIIGHIADDKIAESFNDFMQGNTTDRCLIESLKLISYGDQYVFKTDAACRRLKLVEKRVLTVEEKKKSVDWNRELKSKMDSNLADMKIRYRYSGLHIDELLKQYK
jgi:hypothetical protein